MAHNPRPDKLTPEYVVAHYEKLIRQIISKFKVSIPADDCFQEILLTMIKPSKKMGTSYLDRYDPTVAYASTYLSILSMNQMRKIFLRDKKENEAFNKYGQQNIWTKKSKKILGMVTNPTDLEELRSAENTAEANIFTQELEKAIYSPKTKSFASRSPSGKKRSTFQMCLTMLHRGLNVREVADEFGVSPEEVRRRLKLLASNRKLQNMAKDIGYKVA